MDYVIIGHWNWFLSFSKLLWIQNFVPGSDANSDWDWETAKGLREAWECVSPSYINNAQGKQKSDEYFLHGRPQC